MVAPWEIRERGAPRPGAAIRVGRAWTRSLGTWALAPVRDRPAQDRPSASDVALLASRLAGGVSAPDVPSAAWAAVGAPAVARAASAERELLRRLGAPLGVLEVLDAPPEPDRFDLLAGLRLDAVPPGATSALPGIAQEVLAGWTADGTALIRTLSRQVSADLAVLLLEHAEAGSTWATIRNAIRARVAIGQRHAALIARDQVAKLNSRVAESCQLAAGVTHYTWRAMLDERTRQSHRDAHGLVVAWASEGVPGTGFYDTAAHAGRGGQCRCVPEPVVPDVW